jgi:hypothetical protein
MLFLVLVFTHRSVLAILAGPVLVAVLVAVLVLCLLWAVGDEVSWLAALKARPCCPPRVHSVFMQPLEPPGQQRQLVLSKYIKLII